MDTKLNIQLLSGLWLKFSWNVNSAQNRKPNQKEVWDYEERSRKLSAAQLSLEARKWGQETDYYNMVSDVENVNKHWLVAVFSNTNVVASITPS